MEFGLVVGETEKGKGRGSEGSLLQGTAPGLVRGRVRWRRTPQWLPAERRLAANGTWPIVSPRWVTQVLRPRGIRRA